MENESKILFICTIIFMLDDLPLGKAMAKAQSSSFNLKLELLRHTFTEFLHFVVALTEYFHQRNIPLWLN